MARCPRDIDAERELRDTFAESTKAKAGFRDAEVRELDAPEHGHIGTLIGCAVAR